MLGSKMIVKAHAKINLSLDIVGKRPDGYHEIKTVFHEIPLCDELAFSVIKQKEIVVESSDPALPLGEKNLAYQAAKLLFDEYHPDCGIRIFIDKKIPWGAGLGGGSSDAAATLKAINSIFGFRLSGELLRRYALRLGADVPFFVSGGTAFAKGIGERLVPLNELNSMPMVIAKPNCHVSTVSAYRAIDNEVSVFHPDVDGLVEGIRNNNFEDIYGNIGNSFEAPVFRFYPEIKELKEAFLREGAAASSMTGSGSAVFAFFENERVMHEAVSNMASFCGSTKFYLDNGEIL